MHFTLFTPGSIGKLQWSARIYILILRLHSAHAEMTVTQLARRSNEDINQELPYFYVCIY